jgi:hypothetical protein
MKKLMTAFAVCALAGAVFAQIESQNIVGYATKALVAGDFNMLGATFTSVGTAGFSLNADFSGENLTAGAGSLSADTILIHNAATGVYTTYYLYEGDPSYQAGWYNAGSEEWFDDDYPTGLPAGSSFWYLAKATTTGASVTFSGDVPSTASYTRNLVRADFNMVASPYPVALDLNDPAQVTLTGATAGAGSLSADTILIHNASTGVYTTYYLYEGDPTYQAGWYNAGSEEWFGDDYPTGLTAGTPFWYVAKAGSGDFSMTFLKNF